MMPGNVLDRGVVLLPRSDQLWYKYAYMEEQLGNFVGARQIYERWMEWRPDFLAWTAFVKFELRHKEVRPAFCAALVLHTALSDRVISFYSFVPFMTHTLTLHGSMIAFGKSISALRRRTPSRRRG